MVNQHHDDDESDDSAGGGTDIQGNIPFSSMLPSLLLLSRSDRGCMTNSPPSSSTTTIRGGGGILRADCCRSTVVASRLSQMKLD